MCRMFERNRLRLMTIQRISYSCAEGGTSDCIARNVDNATRGQAKGSSSRRRRRRGGKSETLEGTMDHMLICKPYRLLASHTNRSRELPVTWGCGSRKVV